MYLDASHLYILLWTVISIGIYYAYKRHGQSEYAEGMADAIVMHNSGTLTYKVIVNEDGEEDIEIKINGD